MLLIHQLLEQPALLAYFVGADNYAWLQFRNGERRLLAKPLLYFEKRLPTFVRIHKTALINPVCIASVHQPPRPKMAGSVRLVDGTELPVSRRRWKAVAQLLATSDAAPGWPEPLLPIQADPAQKPATLPRVQVVMSGDALLVTEQCIRELNPPCTLQFADAGAELVSALRLGSPTEWPVLVLIDSRRNRVDSLLTLQRLKADAQLRVIPVIYLIPPGEDTMLAYSLDANSVVVVPEEATALVRVISQLVHYWLTTVRLIA